MTSDIPDAGLRAGYILLCLPEAILRRHVIRCRLQRVHRRVSLTIADAADRLRFVESSFHFGPLDSTVETLRRIGGNQRLVDCNPATAPLLLRDPRERPEPIEASTDEGAIFALLA